MRFGTFLMLGLLPFMGWAAEVRLISGSGLAEPLEHRSLEAVKAEALTKEAFAELFREQIQFQYAVNSVGEWCRMVQFTEEGKTPEEVLREDFAKEFQKVEKARKAARTMREQLFVFEDGLTCMDRGNLVREREAEIEKAWEKVRKLEATVEAKLAKARAKRDKARLEMGREPTLEEAWARYQAGGRFIIRRPDGSKRVSCPECHGEGRVRVERSEGLTGSDDRNDQGVIGGEATKMKSIVCPTCRGLKFTREATGWRYGILEHPEKASPLKTDRAKLTSFLGFPLGAEVAPSQVEGPKLVDGMEVRDVLPEQDFLQFAGYLVGVCPGTLMVHSVVAYDMSLTDPLTSTFSAVSESLRTTYGEACEVKQEDANTLRFVFKANPDRQIVLSRKELKRKKTKAQPQTKAYWLFLQASDAQLQHGDAGGAASGPRSGRLKAEKLKKASEMF